MLSMDALLHLFIMSAMVSFGRLNIAYITKAFVLITSELHVRAVKVVESTNFYKSKMQQAPILQRVIEQHPAYMVNNFNNSISVHSACHE